jgi:hypothetical protein
MKEQDLREALWEASDPETPSARFQRLPLDNKKVALAVARNPSAPPEVLAGIGLRSPEAVLENPCLPPQSLLTLGRYDPQKMLANPLFGLLLLEDPALLKKMPGETFLAVLWLEDPPLTFFGQGIASHAKTPPEILAEVVLSENRSVRDLALLNERTPKEAKARLLSARHWEMRYTLASAPTSWEGALVALSKDRSWKVRLAVAENPKAEALENMRRDPQWQVRRALACHPQASLPLLSGLVRDPKLQVRHALASRESAPKEILVALTEDTAASVRSRVAQNPAAPEEVRAAARKKPPV